MSIAHDGAPSRLAFDKSDRLSKALKLGGMTSNEMAEHLDVSRTTISNYINGRTEPKRSQIRDWAMKTGVPLEWLENGIDTSGPDNDGSRLGESNSRPSHYKADRHLQLVAA